MLVSVVIPSYNGRHLLGECLPTVLGAVGAFDAESVEVIVADDASTDGTAEWLRAEWPTVKVVTLDGNGGFPRAANRAAAAASGDWVAILNNDTSVDAGWITEARLSDCPPGVGAVASKIVNWDGLEIQSAGDGYTRAGMAFHVANGLPRGARHDAGRVFAACAAAAFYRLEAFWDAGGFDESFGGYYEDVDLGFRLNLRGWKTIYAPGSVCRHRVGASYGRLSPRAVASSARNSDVVFFSCMPAGLLARALPARVAAIAAQILLRVGQRRLLPYLSGKMQFLSSLPATLRRRRHIQRRTRVDARDIADALEYRWLRAHLPMILPRRLRSLIRRRAVESTPPVAAALAGQGYVDEPSTGSVCSDRRSRPSTPAAADAMTAVVGMKKGC